MLTLFFAVSILAPSAKRYNPKYIYFALWVTAAVIPVRIKFRDPHGLAGASNAGWCRGDDWHDYALKDASGHPLVPHSEWFCTRLADSIGVSCPPCRVIEENPNSFIFGSRWEGGIPPADIIEIINRGDLQKDAASSLLSRILAFDHFVHNIDRSTSNVVVRNTKYSNVIMAIDFDNAWLRHSFPLPALPLSKQSNTIWFHEYMKDVIGDYVQMDDVNAILDGLMAVQPGQVESIINEHPDVWLPTNLRSQVLSWWASKERFERIEAIRKGIGNGSYL